MYCAERGKQIPDNAKFCGYCGSSASGSMKKPNPTRGTVSVTDPSTHGADLLKKLLKLKEKSAHRKKPGGIGVSFASPNIFRVFQAFVVALLIVQAAMYFVQLGKLEDELVGYLVSQVEDNWSIWGIPASLRNMLIMYGMREDFNSYIAGFKYVGVQIKIYPVFTIAFVAIVAKLWWK